MKRVHWWWGLLLTEDERGDRGRVCEGVMDTRAERKKRGEERDIAQEESKAELALSQFPVVESIIEYWFRGGLELSQLNAHLGTLLRVSKGTSQYGKFAKRYRHVYLRSPDVDAILRCSDAGDVFIYNAQVRDIGQLSAVQRLKLYNCRCYSSPFRPCRVRSVRIAVQPDLRDISFLRFCTTVLLENCVAVTEVSSLSSVSFLEIGNCPRVSCVSSLSSVYDLHLYNLPIIDVSSLGTVRILSLHFLDGVNDVSALSSVSTLRLSSCTKILDVSFLSSVRTLQLRNLNVSCVSSLGSVESLEIQYCKKVRDVSLLSSVRHLRIEDC